MDGAPMPREMRPAIGPFFEAVRLLFRQESLELAGLLTALPMAAWHLRLLVPSSAGPAILSIGGHTIHLVPTAIGLISDFLICGAVLLLLPVARGERGLRLTLLWKHFGLLALAAATKFGAERAELLVSDWIPQNTRGLQGGLEVFRKPILTAWLVAWAAWFLARKLGRRDGTDHAGAWLLFWPGVLAAALAGSLAVGASELASPYFISTRDPPTAVAVQCGYWLWTNLTIVFAALWMIRSVQNESDGWSAVE